MRPPIPSQPNPDYVQCPYCARRFEEYSAERHIPFCKEKNNRIERRSYQGNKAMEKLNKRIQYKPPKLRKKTSDQDTPTSKLSSNPPGYHLVARKSNFSGTYNLDDEPGSPERRSSYQPSYHREVRVRGGGGGPVVRGSVSKTSVHRAGTISHTSATSAGDLPGIVVGGSVCMLPLRGPPRYTGQPLIKGHSVYYSAFDIEKSSCWFWQGTHGCEVTMRMC